MELDTDVTLILIFGGGAVLSAIIWMFKGWFADNLGKNFATKTDMDKLEAKLNEKAQRTDFERLEKKVDEVNQQLTKNQERQIDVMEKIEEQMSILSLQSAAITGSIRHIQIQIGKIEERQWDGTERRKILRRDEDVQQYDNDGNI